jgi:hypothetical protein
LEYLDTRMKAMKMAARSRMKTMEGVQADVESQLDTADADDQKLQGVSEYLEEMSGWDTCRRRGVVAEDEEGWETEEGE